MYPTVRFGAVFRNEESYDAVRCGFEEGENPTVRFGAGNRVESHLNKRPKKPHREAIAFAMFLLRQ